MHNISILDHYALYMFVQSALLQYNINVNKSQFLRFQDMYALAMYAYTKYFLSDMVSRMKKEKKRESERENETFFPKEKLIFLRLDKWKSINTWLFYPTEGTYLFEKFTHFVGKPDTYF